MWWAAFFCFTLTALVCANPMGEEKTYQASDDSSEKTDRYTHPWKQSPLTFPAIEQKLAHLNSVEDFLAWVNHDYPEQMENFTLMRHSQSLQTATPLSPRAIVFGPDAKLIFTFTAKSDNLEIIHFTPQGWEFREIHPSPSTNGKLTLSQANPVRCMSCHTTSLHPLWDDYPSWKDAYGSSDDVILSKTDEANDFERFMQVKEGHPRYRWLKFSDESEVAPFSRTGFNPNYRVRPNLRLTNLLSRQQGKHLVARMSRHQCFSKYRETIIAGFLGCIDITRSHEAMKSLGIELQDYSLKLSPSSYEYYEGELDLQDRILKLLYEQSAGEDSELPSIRFLRVYTHPQLLRGNGDLSGNPIAKACTRLAKRMEENAEQLCAPDCQEKDNKPLSTNKN